MSHTSEEILQTLYARYFEGNPTPADLVSSYWQRMHERSNVRKEGTGFDLKGVGFGDFQYRALHIRILSWLTILAYLVLLPDRRELLRMIRRAGPLCRRLGFPLSYDCFRFLCTMNLLSGRLSLLKPFRVINIGDGYGFLSCLLKELYPKAQICLVDLGKTLFFQAHYCAAAFGQARHHLVHAGSSAAEMNEADFLYCPAEELERLEGVSFDLAVNISSMQEMNETTIGRYFDFFRRNLGEENLFYCCNREKNVMPGGEAAEFLRYPWSAEDRHLLDGPCPWYRFFLSGRPARNGPKMLGRRVPLVNYFDGLHRQRLSILKTAKKLVSESHTRCAT